MAPELVDSYRGDPPGHPPGQEEAYYARQLAWLKQTLRQLREGIVDSSELADQDGQGAERLAALYQEGERLRASILWSTASIPGDLIQGAAVQRQVERERLARDWDERVSGALPDEARMEWHAEKVGVSLRARAPEGEEDMFLAEGHGLDAPAELEAKVARLQNHILPKVRAGEWTRPTVGDT